MCFPVSVFLFSCSLYLRTHIFEPFSLSIDPSEISHQSLSPFTTPNTSTTAATGTAPHCVGKLNSNCCHSIFAALTSIGCCRIQKIFKQIFQPHPPGHEAAKALNTLYHGNHHVMMMQGPLSDRMGLAGPPESAGTAVFCFKALYVTQL